MAQRVVIVGAGPGGLAAAMLLARAGLSVRVLERLPHVGGRTSTLEGGGFRFDLGPTFFLYPRVRLAFSFQSKYLGMSPFNCPSLFSILSFLEYEHGVFHPVGGCGAVTRAMADVVRDLGADVRLNEGVEEILFEGRRAIGVRTARGESLADALAI